MDASHTVDAAPFLHSQTCVSSSSLPHLEHVGLRRYFRFIIIVPTPQMPEVGLVIHCRLLSLLLCLLRSSRSCRLSSLCREPILP